MYVLCEKLFLVNFTIPFYHWGHQWLDDSIWLWQCHWNTTNQPNNIAPVFTGCCVARLRPMQFTARSMPDSKFMLWEKKRQLIAGSSYEKTYFGCLYWIQMFFSNLPKHDEEASLKFYFLLYFFRIWSSWTWQSKGCTHYRPIAANAIHLGPARLLNACIIRNSW